MHGSAQRAACGSQTRGVRVAATHLCFVPHAHNPVVGITLHGCCTDTHPHPFNLATYRLISRRWKRACDSVCTLFGTWCSRATAASHTCTHVCSEPQRPALPASCSPAPRSRLAASGWWPPRMASTSTAGPCSQSDEPPPPYHCNQNRNKKSGTSSGACITGRQAGRAGGEDGVCGVLEV